MQKLNFWKFVTASLVAFTLAACSTTTDHSSSDDAQTSEAGRSGSGVETGAANRPLTPEERRAQEREQRQEKYAELRKETLFYFDFDDASIRSEYQEILAAHADYLVRNPRVNVVIEGHTDERGTPDYNIALGERRAKSVYDYLQTLGVSATQMSLVSYGEEKPVVRQSNERAWSQNRRAVLVY